MTRKTGTVLGVVVWLLLLSPVLQATSVKTVNIREMVNLSGTIFYGRCLSAVDSLADSGLGVRTYRFLVLEALKNAEAGQIVEFRQVAAVRRGGFSIPDMPQFTKGQKLLLFLHRESKWGLTSPVGFQQGVFRARKLQNGEIAFENGFSNRNLSYGMQPEVQAQAGLQEPEVQAIRSGEPVTLPVLRDIVTKLDLYNEQTRGRVQ